MSPHAAQRPKAASDAGAPSPGEKVAEEITTADLLSVPACGPRVVSDARRVLMVGGLPVATLGPDPSRINPLCARSATGMPVIEMLAAIASQDPTGVLAIESASGSSGFAFNVHRGRVVSAKGPGPLGQLEPWCAAVHQRFPERFDCALNDAARAADPSWIRVAKTFVGERTLDHLELALQPGVQLSFVRGDVQWIGTSLVHDRAPTLSHLLLEHARRSDERPRLYEQLGALAQIAIPLSEPPNDPSSSTADKHAEGGPDEHAEGDPDEHAEGSGDNWDFFDDPDPAALEEWADARALWPLCDGQHSIEEAVEFSMLGRFRALAAMATLADRRHVVLVSGETLEVERSQSVGEPPRPAESSQPGAEIVELRGPATHPTAREPVQRSTGYSLTRPSKGIGRLPTTKRSRPSAVEAEATAVAPRTIGETASAVPEPVKRETTEPLASASFSMMAFATAKAATRNPNVRLIAMAFLAAGLFVSGAAAALAVVRVAEPAAATEPPPGR